jgi:GR25 family glycosyltransferase involved in LPS biosynthesis
MGRTAVCMMLCATVAAASAAARPVQHRAQRARRPPPKSGLRRIEHKLVINLESRADRLANVTAVLASMGVPDFAVVKAIPHACGALGCALSHVTAVQMCADSDAGACLVMEDDFELTVDPDAARALVDRLFDEVPAAGWDVVFLSSNVIVDRASPYAMLRRIVNAQTTSAYIVAKHYAPKLLNAYIKSASLLNQFGCNKNLFAVDMFTKALQPFDKWYVFHPKLGKQRTDFSDIELQTVDYNVR